MNLLGGLGIQHSVLFDGDGGNELQNVVNDFIKSVRNEFTRKIDSFPDDLEAFLGIPATKRRDHKAINAFVALQNKTVTDDRLYALKAKVQALLM